MRESFGRVHGSEKNCDNWRGIILLSIPSIFLAGIDRAIDTKLRQEQEEEAEGCIVQIFVLKNIIEQCIEWITLNLLIPNLI